MGLTGRALAWTITATSVTGFSLFGYDQGLMSGLITGDEFNQEFPGTKKKSDDDRHATVVQGAVTACYEIGCFFGAIFVLLAGNYTGRKPLIVSGSVIIIVGTVISVASFKDSWGTGQFVIGRVITGIGNGLNTATIPVWQSEMSKAEKRGMLVSFEGSVVAVGTMIAYWIDFGFSFINSSVQWRFPVAFQIVFAALLFVGIINLPDSPRWLLANNRKEDAYKVLGALNNVDPHDDEVIAEATVITEAINRFRNSQVGLKELFAGGKSQHFARMVIGSSTQFFQQFTGCNAAIYYSTVLFQDTIFNGEELKRTLALVLGGVFSTIYALFTIPSFFLVEKVGRRNLFLIGATGQAISFTITFGCLVRASESNDYANGAAVGLFLFICFFAFTILPLPWIYPPEINPLRTRTLAAAISTCTNWITNFAVVMFTPIFINDGGNRGWGCYLFFALLNYIFIPVIFFFYPETAGRSLEEIDIIFAKAYVDGAMPWRVAATMPHLSLEQQKEQGFSLGLFDDIEKEEGEQRVHDLLEKNDSSVEKNDSSGDSNSNKPPVVDSNV